MREFSIVPPNGGEQRRRALIVGGGIAGSATALFLKRAGFDPVIFEGRQPDAADESRFMTLAPNGLRVLEALDLAVDIRFEALATSRVVFSNHAGKRLGSVARDAVTIRQSALLRILHGAVASAGIPIRHGKWLKDLWELDGRVHARFADGSAALGDLLIGCDGAHSRTRRMLFPGGPALDDTRMISSGGIAELRCRQHVDDEMHLVFGKHGLFGYVADRNRVYWFSNVRADYDGAAARAAALGQWRSYLLDLHAGEPGFVSEVIWATPDEVVASPIHVLPSLPRWSEGHAVLVGDAAHAMSPHGGQGLSLALEDALALGRCLRDAPTIVDAFGEFERHRRNRVERVGRWSRRKSLGNTPASPWLRWLRDNLMPIKLRVASCPTQRALLDDFDADFDAAPPAFATRSTQSATRR